MRLAPLLLAALLSPTALAEGSDGFGIYEVNPDLTTGRMEFFREVYVDPATISESIKPKKALPAGGPKTGDLRIRNGANGWQEVRINDVRVGQVGPLTTAIIHDMPSGLYEVTLTMPNGFAYTSTVSTAPEGQDGPIRRSDAVQPVPIPVGAPPATAPTPPAEE
ncbi:MAG: hypothetical protein H6740_28520 [Alphaproteobacteria bacterium]|nr:hypothetical protein [Alphaproteobacteria bacterium]